MPAEAERSNNTIRLSALARWDDAAWVVATGCLVVARYDLSLNGIARHVYQGGHAGGSYTGAVRLPMIALVVGVVFGVVFVASRV